jgi:pimeloyl-ACP methyl ester carboxylesterase
MLTDVSRRRISLPGRGVEIALLDWGGSGPLALLHHANGFCAGVWGLVAESLRDRFRVVAMDARGHGDSTAPAGREAYRWEHFALDAAEVAARLGAEHGRIAVGLGHSFGGTALLGAAARRPELFERLVLVDPIFPPTPGPKGDGRRRAHTSPLAEGARKRREIWPSREQARARWVGKDLFTDWDPRALDLYLAEGLRDRDDSGVELKCAGETEATIFESSAEIDVFAIAARVTTPVLIQRAARGQFSREHFEAVAAAMADARVVDVDAGHLVPMERPELVCEAVLAFAAEPARRAQFSTG